MSLDGIGLVTGAGSGIGRAVAVAYAKAGCRGLALADINATSINETIGLIKEAGLNTEVIAVELDITNPQAVRNLVATTVEKFGRLDYAANVAGVNLQVKTTTVDAPLADFDRLIDINLRAQLLCCQEEIRAMLKQEPVTTPGVSSPLRAQRGSIVNIASVSGLLAIQNMMAYTVAKHGVIGLTKSAAVDHGHQLIRVNCICPGVIETPFLLPTKRANPTSTFHVDGTVFNRVGQPEEIADACVFLSSCQASFATGSSMIIDGGHSAAARYEKSMQPK